MGLDDRPTLFIRCADDGAFGHIGVSKQCRLHFRPAPANAESADQAGAARLLSTLRRFGSWLMDPSDTAASDPFALLGLPRGYAVDRAALDETDQLAYDVFAYQTRDALRGLTPEMLQVHHHRAAREGIAHQ